MRKKNKTRKKKVNILKKYKSWFDALEYYDTHRKLPFEKTKVLVSMSDEAKRKFKDYCKKKHTNMSAEVERLVKGLVKVKT